MSGREVEDWVKGFLFYTQESESPDSYLQWTAYATISAALQRRVWTKWIYWDYYPNIYVILVGPPGIVHKTATIKFGIEMLRLLEIGISSEVITREALILDMKRAENEDEVCAMPIMVSEFDDFIDASGTHMIRFLTNHYDAPDVYRYTTKHGGKDEIRNSYITILGGVVPSWISQEFDETFIEKGFASRVLFVCESRPRFFKATANITPAMESMHGKLVRDLTRISQLEGEYVWTDAATEWFTHWYERDWPLQEVDYRIKSYHNRKPTHLLKLSMLVAASLGDQLILDVPHMEKALSLIKSLEPSMLEAFSGVGRNPYATDMERIAAEIKRSGGMSKGELVQRNTHAMNRQVLDELLENLQLMGEVEKSLKGGNVYYTPARG